MKSFSQYLDEATTGKYRAVIHYTDSEGNQRTGEVRHSKNRRPLRAAQMFGDRLPKGSKVTKVEYPDDNS